MSGIRLAKSKIFMKPSYSLDVCEEVVSLLNRILSGFHQENMF